LFSGMFSCLAMDIWQQILRRLAGIPATNWSIVGRWFLEIFLSRKIYNPKVGETPNIKNENLVGWVVHYSVALAYSIVFWFLLEIAELVSATVTSGLIFGVISVVIPWFFFMPCLGNGVLGRKTPNPVLTCVLALASHSVIGMSLGLSFSLFSKLI